MLVALCGPQDFTFSKQCETLRFHRVVLRRERYLLGTLAPAECLRGVELDMFNPGNWELQNLRGRNSNLWRHLDIVWIVSTALLDPWSFSFQKKTPNPYMFSRKNSPINRRFGTRWIPRMNFRKEDLNLGRLQKLRKEVFPDAPGDYEKALLSTTGQVTR